MGIILAGATCTCSVCVCVFVFLFARCKRVTAANKSTYMRCNPKQYHVVEQ